jgi:hypothetical protein
MRRANASRWLMPRRSALDRADSAALLISASDFPHLAAYGLHRSDVLGTKDITARGHPVARLAVELGPTPRRLTLR